MSKKEENNTIWSLEIGFYPGVLVGARTYEEEDKTTWVLYVPFVDVAFTKFN